MENKIRVLVKEPKGELKEKVIKDDFKDFMGLVDGYIEPVYVEEIYKDRGITIYVNDSGRLNGLPFNINVPTYGGLLGTIVFSKVNGMGDGITLSDEDIEFIKSLDWVKS